MFRHQERGTEVDWFRQLLEDAAAGLLGLLDSLVPAVPPAVGDACAVVASAGADMAAWSWLVPWEALAVAVGIVVVCVVASMVIRAARMGVSVLTGGGGA